MVFLGLGALFGGGLFIISPSGKLNSARLTFNYKDLSLFYIVTFNNLGEIVQLDTKRYMDQKQLVTWIIKLGNYTELNGVKVPVEFEVMWRLKESVIYGARLATSFTAQNFMAVIFQNSIIQLTN